MPHPTSSDYVNNERRDYSLYVLQSRAIPHAADGLKAAARRVLWTAKDGKKYKSATLAGATMPIHPHQTPEGAVNTLAAPYGNNIPLLDGDGAFGTLLAPNAYGAARYTSVKVSEFTRDVVFRDIEIVPLQENYDGTLEEPKHFLPLIPIVLLNPQDGIAVGFASSILPRALDSIVNAQVDYLTTGTFGEDLPNMVPLNQQAWDWTENASGGYKYVFRGHGERVNATTLRITDLPYGLSHEKYIAKLDKMEEAGTIQGYTDNSRDTYNIEIRFKRGVLSNIGKEQALVDLLELDNWVSENMNVIDFDGERVWSTTYQELIAKFTEWRLEWYVTRYERLAGLLEIDIQRYKDVLRAIDRNVGMVARKTGSRSELKEFLTEIGIVHLDYIADLPVYRFTLEEKKKVELKLKEAEATMKKYQALLKSPKKRRELYVEELNEILAKYKRGKYGSK